MPRTTVPLDDISPRAVVQVHVIQEQIKDGCRTTPPFVQYSATPLRKPDRKTGIGNGGRVEEAHTERGTKFPRWRWLEGLCLLECRGAGRLVFVVVLVVLVLVVVVPHVRHRSLHAGAAVVRVV